MDGADLPGHSSLGIHITIRFITRIAELLPVVRLVRIIRLVHTIRLEYLDSNTTSFFEDNDFVDELRSAAQSQDSARTELLFEIDDDTISISSVHEFARRLEGM